MSWSQCTPFFLHVVLSYFKLESVGLLIAVCKQAQQWNGAPTLRLNCAHTPLVSSWQDWPMFYFCSQWTLLHLGFQSFRLNIRYYHQHTLHVAGGSSQVRGSSGYTRKTVRVKCGIKQASAVLAGLATMNAVGGGWAGSRLAPGLADMLAATPAHYLGHHCPPTHCSIALEASATDDGVWSQRQLLTISSF